MTDRRARESWYSGLSSAGA